MYLPCTNPPVRFRLFTCQLCDTVDTNQIANTSNWSPSGELCALGCMEIWRTENNTALADQRKSTSGNFKWFRERKSRIRCRQRGNLPQRVRSVGWNLQSQCESESKPNQARSLLMLIVLEKDPKCWCIVESSFQDISYYEGFYSHHILIATYHLASAE